MKQYVVGNKEKRLATFIETTPTMAQMVRKLDGAWRICLLYKHSKDGYWIIEMAAHPGWKTKNEAMVILGRNATKRDQWVAPRDARKMKVRLATKREREIGVQAILNEAL